MSSPSLASDDRAAARVAILGAGPAGLMAAESALAAGARVEIYDAMPSFGRKFLMAGKSGLNITRREDLSAFMSRYAPQPPALVQAIEAFGPDAVQAWMQTLGIDAFTGTTARVFPTGMKASPLLRAWLARLTAGGVQGFTRHRWSGWTREGALRFDTVDGEKHISPDAVVFAFGGASWARLGSDGAWAEPFRTRNIPVADFQPSNMGVRADWPMRLVTHAGAPLKPIRLTAPGGATSRGECVITREGLEGGGIYAVSADLRVALAAQGHAHLMFDLAPDLSLDLLTQRLSDVAAKVSFANRLRKAAHLSPQKIALAGAFLTPGQRRDAAQLAAGIKALRVPISGFAPLDRAISTVGGVSWQALDDSFMLRALPAHFCAGEMVDWDAPTGGYLLTACLATGRVAGAAAAAWAQNAQST